jgi:hypothetical protein
MPLSILYYALLVDSNYHYRFCCLGVVSSRRVAWNSCSFAKKDKY